MAAMTPSAALAAIVGTTSRFRVPRSGRGAAGSPSRRASSKRVDSGSINANTKLEEDLGKAQADMFDCSAFYENALK